MSKKLSSSDSVANMVLQVTGDEELASRLETSAKNRDLINRLIACRVKCDLSQNEVAAQLSRSQRDVSKFENTDDADLRFGDIVDYVKAIGLLVTITMSKLEKE